MSARGLTVGTKAPEITLFDQDKQQRPLSGFWKGGNAVLAFFPGAFTSVCTKEMCTFRDQVGKLGSLQAQVVGVSVDSPFALKGFAEKNSINFPLMSDHDRRAVKAYGVELPDFAGMQGYTAAQRSVFIVGRDGFVKYAWVALNPGVEPDYAEIEKRLG
ncbi:MAG: redoxin domain-containing protein [Nitrososphaerota archaeon]|nr:redoxin domain-containing protein [Nitrososphaerota archaeon]